MPNSMPNPTNYLRLRPPNVISRSNQRPQAKSNQTKFKVQSNARVKVVLLCPVASAASSFPAVSRSCNIWKLQHLWPPIIWPYSACPGARPRLPAPYPDSGLPVPLGPVLKAIKTKLDKNILNCPTHKTNFNVFGCFVGKQLVQAIT